MEYKKYACLSGLSLALLIMPGCEWQTCRKEEQKTIQQIAQEKDDAKNEIVAEETDEETDDKKEFVKKTAKKHNGVIEIKSTHEFDELLKEGKPVIAKIYSPTCPPCKRMKPIFEEISHKYPDINFAAVDDYVSQNAAISNRYGVESYPSFIFIDASGKVIEKHGPSSKEEFDKKVAAFAKKMI